jgi:putative ABC transport system substrate-binding protein
MPAAVNQKTARALGSTLSPMVLTRAMWFDRQAVVAGGLISLSANTNDIFERAAVMTDKVLKGAKPADLPVEQPAIFELVINLKVAKELGLTLPRSVQVQANELIE